MSTVSITIPRFLLPQLTWKGTVPKTFAIAAASSPAYHPPRRNSPPQRSISSQARARIHPDNTLPSHQLSSRCHSAPSSHRRPSSIINLVPSRSFATTPTHYRDHHFDTLKFVQRLRDEGFSEEQATAMMHVLSDVIEESIQNLTRTMVLREGNPPLTPCPCPPFPLLGSVAPPSPGAPPNPTST